MTQLGDELLVAYRDGELSTRQRDAVARVLEVDPVASHRIKSLNGATKRLRQAFDDMLGDYENDFVLDALSHHQAKSTISQPSAQAVPMKNEGIHLRSEPKIARGMGGLMMGILIGFLMAAALGTAYYFVQMQREKPDNNKKATSVEIEKSRQPVLTDTKGYRPILDGEWSRAVVHHHAISVQEGKLSGLSPDAASAQVMVRSTLNMHGFQLPDFTEQGLNFDGFQIISHRGKKIAQFVFKNKERKAVSLYVQPQAGIVPIERQNLGDINGIHWSGQNIGYVLVGAQPHWSLMVLSVNIKRQNGIAN